MCFSTTAWRGIGRYMPISHWSRLPPGFTGCSPKEPALPGRLARIAPYMAADDWLGSYREFAVMEQVLRGIGRRLTRPEELGHAMQELRALYEPLSGDFRVFYPGVQRFSNSQLAIQL